MGLSPTGSVTLIHSCGRVLDIVGMSIRAGTQGLASSPNSFDARMPGLHLCGRAEPPSLRSADMDLRGAWAPGSVPASVAA